MRPAAAEQPLEHVGKVLVHALEGAEEPLAALAIELTDAAAQPRDGLDQILALGPHG